MTDFEAAVVALGLRAPPCEMLEVLADAAGHVPLELLSEPGAAALVEALHVRHGRLGFVAVVLRW